MKRYDLNDNWQLRQEPLSWSGDRYPEVRERTDGWLEAEMPTDIRVPLIAAGVIKDPVEALYSYDSEWVEDRSWWFRKRFDCEASMLREERVELVLESIDVEGDVFLNGRHLGHHRSAHYPFVHDVTGVLLPTGNELIVRATTGNERYSAEQAAPFTKSVSKTYRRGDERRVFLRKPQYVYGWDWGPRIATCGLVKDIYLRAATGVAVRGYGIETRSVSPEQAQLHVVVEVENLHTFKTREGEVRVDLRHADGGVASSRTVALLSSGLNFIELDCTIEKPRLWWPNGMGEQALYEVAISVTSGGDTDAAGPFRYGVRTLEFDMSELGGGARMFAATVNGKKVFCKGGNWIPADSVYARVSDTKYEALIREAKEANFTMLRIWGGGIYERDVFYETCDEMGILVWHDFMFACALYPDDRDWFVREVEREIDYQTKRLRNHSCMALWSGNNENHWGFRDWWIGERQAEFPGGAHIYNTVAPEIVRKNSPWIFYWRSSPYGGEDPNGNEVGDRHHWHDCTMNPDMEKRITPEEYDKITSKFVSEYGYIGPCAKATIEQYHAGFPIERFSELWNWHNNTFEKDTVVAGITKHYRDADTLSLDEYLLYSGLVQGLMYGYSLEAIRIVENCWGSIFWMYNDCWGEVGWTIIDYYLRRKPSFYYVKRAFAPVKLILRRRGTDVVVFGGNDTGDEVKVELEHGYLSFDGRTGEAGTRAVTIAPYWKGELFSFPLGSADGRTGTWYARPVGDAGKPAVSGQAPARQKPSVTVPTEDGRAPAPVTLRSATFRELSVPTPTLSISGFSAREGEASFVVTGDVFAHAVHFGLEEQYRLSDSFFDLLPGESRRVTVSTPGTTLTAEQVRPRSVT